MSINELQDEVIAEFSDFNYLLIWEMSRNRLKKNIRRNRI